MFKQIDEEPKTKTKHLFYVCVCDQCKRVCVCMFSYLKTKNQNKRFLIKNPTTYISWYFGSNYYVHIENINLLFDFVSS